MTTATGYITDLDYIPGFYPHMSPTAIRYAASLNRVIPPATADNFRYLELGCGLGTSLTTLAAANPQGEFVGIDINPSHIETVDQNISAGGLNNAKAIHSDFTSLPNNIGTFEFISLHGVFSWVSPEVREQILSIAKNHLAPGGLLLVSYNAMPGWAHLQPIRGILRQYAELRQGDTTQRIRDALTYLVFIRDKKAKYFEDNPQAAAYVDSLLKQDLRYLAHEYLNEHWTSFYFSEVAAMFRSVEMAFVGSLPIHTNFWDLCVRPEFQDLFRTTSNRLVTESHKDFCANTAFRWDIYSKQPQVIENVEDRLRLIDNLYFRAVRNDIKLPHKINLGVVSSTVQGPLYEILLTSLSQDTLTLAEILSHPQLTENVPADIIRAVDAGVAMGLFEVAAGPLPPLQEKIPEHPLISLPFNQFLLKNEHFSGRPVSLACAATGTGYSLSDFDAAILYELSEAGKNGLADRVLAQLTKSERSIQKDGKPITDDKIRREVVEETCARFLSQAVPQLYRLGILESRPSS